MRACDITTQFHTPVSSICYLNFVHGSKQKCKCVRTATRGRESLDISVTCLIFQVLVVGKRSSNWDFDVWMDMIPESSAYLWLVLHVTAESITKF